MHGVGFVPEAARGDGYVPRGAHRVSGEDAGDGGGESVEVVGEEGAEVEVERRGSPERAPPGG